MSKNLKIFLIILLSLITISLVSLMILLINKKIKFPNMMFEQKVSDELVVDRQYENNLNKIYIDADASNVYIKRATDNQVRVIVYGKEDKATVNVNNDHELTIITKGNNCFGICFNFTMSKVEIYLPDDYANKIEVVNNYGDIYIDHFLEAEIDINEDCGNVRVDAGRIVSINSSYGDINLGKVNKALIKGSAGNIKIDEVNDAEVENDFGDIEIGKIRNYLDIRNNSGDITIDNVSLEKNSSIKCDFGDVKIGSTNEIYIVAKADFGDTEIDHNYNKSDITLTVENNCGDIEINN